MFTIIGFVTILSCNKTSLYSEFVEITTNKWEINDVKTFDVHIEKPKLKYNIFIEITNDKDYATSNLWLYISSESPSKKIQTDTVMFLLTDNKGHWYGKEAGDNVENAFLYKKAISFPERGNYKFSIQHGMRPKYMPTVKKIGLKLEQAIRDKK